MTYYVYIMASASHALYTGVTNNIEQRVVQHREAHKPRFSARYKTRNLVHLEIFGDIRAAITREKPIKGWLRSKKLTLINSANPNWNDLSADWPKSKGVIASPGEGVTALPGKGVILSPPRRAKNPSEDFLDEKAVAKNSSEGFAGEKEKAERQTNQTPRRDSSSPKPGLRMTAKTQAMPKKMTPGT